MRYTLFCLQSDAGVIVIRIPAYAEMIPECVYAVFNKLRGDRTPAILTVYGNISKGPADDEVQVIKE
jgi:hypothetical protein